MLAEMGGLAEDQLAEAHRRARRAATSTLADAGHRQRREDRRAEREIEEKAILIIALRQPMARDLREIMAAIHIATDLERIGDLAKNIAKRAHAIADEHRRASIVDAASSAWAGWRSGS